MAPDRELPQLLQFDTTIVRWINALDRYTLEQLCQPPRAGSWSLGQVYRHIIDDTGWFAGQMKEALESRENGDKAMHPHARAMFERNGFPDIQIEGPATNTFIPQPQSKEQLARDLMVIRTAVDELFRTFDPMASTGKTRHPGLDYFTALEWLQFSEMHMRHHLRQKQRIDQVLFAGTDGDLSDAGGLSDTRVLPDTRDAEQDGEVAG